MVHIMMATYNGEKYIREQLESIIHQTYSDWKLWINDDGSTDDTLTILKIYAERYSQKIELLSSEVKKLGAKGNFAYLYENTPFAEYYAFCDQDDVWEKDKITMLLSALMQGDQNFSSLIYHDVQVVDKDKSMISPSFYDYSGIKIKQDRKLQQVLMYNYIPGSTMMFNHKLKEKVIQIPKGCFMHDWWLLMSALSLDARIIKVDKSLGQYRQHRNNDMGAEKKKNLLQMSLKCMDIINLQKYRSNIKRMKLVRISQAELLIKNYLCIMTNNNNIIINDFLKLLNGKHKWENLYEAVKKGFIFDNVFKTIKFYLL